MEIQIFNGFVNESDFYKKITNVLNKYLKIHSLQIIIVLNEPYLVSRKPLFFIENNNIKCINILFFLTIYLRYPQVFLLRHLYHHHPSSYLFQKQILFLSLQTSFEFLN